MSLLFFFNRTYSHRAEVPVAAAAAPKPVAPAFTFAQLTRTSIGWLTVDLVSPPRLLPRAVSVSNPIGVLGSPASFGGLAWMEVGLYRSPPYPRAPLLSYAPVGVRLLPPPPLLPASADFTAIVPRDDLKTVVVSDDQTARVTPDEYVLVVRYNTLTKR